MSPSTRRLAAVVAVALLAVACSSDDADDESGAEPSATATAEAASEPTPEPTPEPTAEPEPLLIVVTNDDGVGSDGIAAVADALLTIPDVEIRVVAPAENQSGTGDRQSDAPPSAADTTTASGYDAVGVDGFPADSVVYALGELALEPHLVVSGANEGQNIGVFVNISGTVGAAKTAVRLGVPALALSANNEDPDYEAAADIAVEFVIENEEALRDRSAPLEVTTINIPTCSEGGQVGEVTVPIADDFGGLDPFTVDCSIDVADPATDVEAYTAGYIAISTLEVGPDPLQADTDLGVVRGFDAGPQVRAFLTIPYAASPTGENRFRPPQPHPGWDERLAATEPGMSCPQPEDELISQFTPTPPSDEDCLTLSVWSPAAADALPVMVWIHGGGFTTGSAHQPLYDGADLASEGVVVVNINYRLGALGFLATEAIKSEDPDGAVGNLGIADQQAALEWVERNISVFGGDPDNVTVFGESAGGFSVCALLATDAAGDLFDKAVIQSGGGCTRLFDEEAAFDAGAQWVESVGCAGEDELLCLRELPVDDIVAAGSEGLGLVADGVRMTETAYDLASAGELADLPILIGSNHDEATLFTIGFEVDFDVEAAAAELGGDSGPELLALYPPGDYPTNLARFQAMSTDMTFACPALAFADVAADRGPTFSYEYTYVSPSDPFDLGATHGAELVFLFSNPEGIAGLGEIDDESLAVSDEIQSAWVSFAATGAPSAGVDWPETAADARAIMQLDSPFALVEEIRDGRCDAIADLGLIP